MESSAGPVVTFPDPALVAQIATLEAPRARSVASFSWARSIGWSFVLTLAGSALYAGVVYATDKPYGIVAIVIGVLAGFGAARGGRGRNAQIVGASMAAVGYFLALLFALAVIVGPKIFQVPVSSIADVMWMMIKGTFSGMDALFLGFAVWEGWRIPAARE